MSISIHDFLTEANKLKNKNWVFRGLKEVNYDCVTSFSRTLSDIPEKNRISETFANELVLWHELLKDTIKYVSGKTEINDKTLWTFVQHFKEKTNLLDVTICPKVALGFASNFRRNSTKPYKIIAFNLDPELKDKSQSDASVGYCVSLVDPLNLVFPQIKSKVSASAFANNKRIEAQKGAFLYCNRHLLLENIPGFNFEPKYVSKHPDKKLFDFHNYFEHTEGYKIKVFTINPEKENCSCKLCSDSILEESSLLPNLPLSEATEHACYARIIDAFMYNLPNLGAQSPPAPSKT